jgi:RNA polymerase sigma-70 factor (ECF subfamily)
MRGDTVTTPDDTELMRDVGRGRTGALATLFERHHARLYRFCLRMTGNRQASEDLVQDVFMRILKYRTSFKNDMVFAPWMFGIARNTCADYLRQAALERGPALEHGSSETAVAEPTVASAGEDAAQQDQAELVRRALLALPVEGREVLVLSRYEFKTYEQIARALDCSVGAVKVRVHRAIKRLRKIYLEMAQEASI